MGLAKLKTKISVDDYLEGEEIGSERYEYLYGEVYLMAGTSLNHNRIAGNLYSALLTRLNKPGCDTFIENIKVRTTASVFYYPDVIVTCEGAFQNKYYSETPVLIVEVISPSTERVDRLEKLPAYKAMPSVMEIVIVDQEKVAVEIHRRLSETEWAHEFYDSLDETFHLASVNLHFKVSEVYERVIFDPKRQLHPAESGQI